MGTEVALFRVIFKKSQNLKRIIHIITEFNFQEVEKKERLINYELDSNYGILELQVFLSHDQVNDVYLRFSYGNPKEIIDQLFLFIKKLLENVEFDFYYVDRKQGSKLILITSKSLNGLKGRLIRKKKFFDKHYMKIDKPIRGGKETFDYIHSHKKTHKTKEI